MREMKRAGSESTLKVERVVILKNFWEYFLEAPDKDGVSFGFVMGFADELGYVSLDEIAPYAISTASGKELNEVLPASGWNWVNK